MATSYWEEVSLRNKLLNFLTMANPIAALSLERLRDIYHRSISTIFTPILDKRKIASRQIFSLDGLRGIAVVLVFLEHITGNIFPKDSWLNFGEAHMGRSGVYLFFVLSSFLLTSQLIRPHITLNKLEFWFHYASRRIMRIYPLYLSILLIYLVFPSFKFDLFDFFRHATLQAGRNHFWSIPVEVKYYLILPLLAWFIMIFLRRNLKIAILVLIALTLIASVAKATVLPSILSEPRLSILPNLPIFFIGSLAAITHAKILEWGPERREKLQNGMEIVAFVTAVLLFCSLRTVWSQFLWLGVFGTEMPVFAANHWFYDIQAALWAIFMLSHLHGLGWTSRLLSFSVLRFIGVISFGIYLWHIAVMGYLMARLNSMPDLVQTIAISAVTLLVATVTYVLIERPFMQIKFSFAGMRQK
jgi:peptidoglycan/LPS O-acetylase OafA/YrhL